MPASDNRLGGVLEFVESRFASQIRARCMLEAQPGTFAPIPPQLDPRLRKVLEQDGIHELYAHQAEALERFLIESNASNACTMSLLDALIDGIIRIPEVRTMQSESGRGMTPPPGR